MSDELVDRLVAELTPVRPRAGLGRLAIGVGGGVVLSALLMLLWLGLRPDFSEAVTTSAFWMKFVYTLGLGIVAFAAADRLARPGGTAQRAAIAAFAIVAVIGVLAVAELLAVAPAERAFLVLGGSAAVCPWRIVVLSAPVFIGTFWAMRGLAPTRLPLAGLAAGFAAGTIGAWIYAFQCTESAAPFVAVWYTIGIAAVTILGALAGRYLLRW